MATRNIWMKTAQDATQKVLTETCMYKPQKHEDN